jgi:xanthine dehydrogenase accessory factor
VSEKQPDLFTEIVRLRAEGVPLALATIVQCDGSTPQRPGAKLLVREAGPVAGTLGGGCMEAEVIAVARQVLREGTARTVGFNLDERAGGLVCGGSVQVFVEPLVPQPRLVILGAGHVGRALARAAQLAGFSVTVADDRPEYADAARLPEASEVVVGPFGEVFAQLSVGADAYIVVVTRGHKHDFTAVRGALGTPARYIGLVGSRTKRELLLEHLAEEGFGPEQRSRVITPAGLAIGAVAPEEIAVSIVAQLIQIRRGHGTAPGGRGACCGDIAADGQREAQAAAPARWPAGVAVEP